MSAKTWRAHPEATAELVHATDTYEAQREGLGEDFLASYRARYSALIHTPKVGTAERVKGREVRRGLLDGFPYAIVFVELDDEYLVVAVAYGGRKPGYWKKRLRALR